ncbi:MAG: MFS transporter, partial [Dehalococcoidia bacterium]|nr:MFS transporter [Dehalococcoidia bacterium]
MVSRVRSIARGQFYYGWVIVAVGFIIGLVMVTFRLYSFGVFVKPISEDMGWSRTAISGVLSFSTVVEGLAALLIGSILDKRGARLLMVFGIAITGVGFIALGFMQTIWQFYLIRAFVIGIGLTCGGNLPINVSIANWFIRKRGKAVSIGLMGASLGGAVMTPFAAYLISVYGWRSAWVVCGVLM